MTDALRLMCVLAHPDDETLGTGGTLVKYAGEGVETYLVTATRGERGWWGDEAEYPGLVELGNIREAELRSAAQVLGIQDLFFLDYTDGDLDKADPGEAVAKIAGFIKKIKPHVVITFDPYGVYGHPDHIAISQFTTAAILSAATSSGSSHTESNAPHSVSKLYYIAELKEYIDVYQSVFGEVSMTVDGQKRLAVAWEDWAITTRINTYDHWRTVWQAVLCHRSQFPGYHRLENLSESQRQKVWGTRTYYRVFSNVNGGSQVESDLFEGLRPGK
jgi:LmbE family N-acetylglucosaminyl deacetylase